MLKQCGIIFEIMERYCNTSRLRYRSCMCSVLFNFIAREFEGIFFRENFKEIFQLGASRVYFDIYVINNLRKYCAFYNHIRLWAPTGGGVQK